MATQEELEAAGQKKLLARSFSEPMEEAAARPVRYDDVNQRTYNQDLMNQLYLSGALQAAQLGAASGFGTQLETTKENQARLDELNRLKEQGRLGLTGAEQAQMEQTMLAPVRGVATEQRQRSEAMMATEGNRSSAADLQRAQMASQQQAQAAALQAGAAISKANLDRAQEQLRELQQRTAFKAEQQKQRREMGAQAIGQLGGLIGQVQATKAVESIDMSQVPAEAYDSVASILNEAMSDPNPINRQRRLAEVQTLISSFGSRE